MSSTASKAKKEQEDELPEYEEEEETMPKPAEKVAIKKGYSGVSTYTFKDFTLKPELLRAIADCGFEHPSDVQHECLPVAINGQDVVCQAKAGSGKTAVFVLSILQQMQATDVASGNVLALVMCHNRNLAYQICREFERFSTHLSPRPSAAVFYGGLPVQEHIRQLQTSKPTIVIGTPGRILDLVRRRHLNLTSLRHFVIDECDAVLRALDMRADVQEIFKTTPKTKQVMFFTATLPKEIRSTCKKMLHDPLEVLVDDETKLVLANLHQHYVELSESEKNRRLTELLDALEFNQVIIFMSTVERAEALGKILRENNFPAIPFHSRMSQSERIEKYEQIKQFKARIIVATDLLGRGVDFEGVNVVVNYDMPGHDAKTPDTTDQLADQYLHRAGRAGRFGTNGLVISFVSSDKDVEVLNQVQSRFEVGVSPLPDISTINPSTYTNA